MKWLAGFFRALATPFRLLNDPEGRRGWALMLMAGGGSSMTIYAGVGLYLVREHANYVFYLALASLGLILVVLTGYAGLLVKRTIKGSVLGNSIEISDDQANQIAGKVAAAIPPPPPPPPAPSPTVVVQTGSGPTSGEVKP